MSLKAHIENYCLGDNDCGYSCAWTKVLYPEVGITGAVILVPKRFRYKGVTEGTGYVVKKRSIPGAFNVLYVSTPTNNKGDVDRGWFRYDTYTDVPTPKDVITGYVSNLYTLVTAGYRPGFNSGTIRPTSEAINEVVLSVVKDKYVCFIVPDSYKKMWDKIKDSLPAFQQKPIMNVRCNNLVHPGRQNYITFLIYKF